VTGSERIRIAAAQSPVTLDPARNGDQIRRLMRSAHEHGARLIQFPEGALSGYPAGAHDRSGHVARTATRDELSSIAELARELRLWVVVGGNHALTPPNRPHNSLYVISDRGEPVDRYDKRRCSSNELENWYTPGFERVVFDVDGFRFGCVLCIEINFPDLIMEYLDDGVDCVLFSSHSQDPIFDVVMRGHAATNNLWFSVAVPAHCSEAMPAGVVGPHGYRLGACSADGGADLVCVDLDRGDPSLDIALNKARPWRAAARAGDVYALRRVDDPRSADRATF